MSVSPTDTTLRDKIVGGVFLLGVVLFIAQWCSSDRNEDKTSRVISQNTKSDTNSGIADREFLKDISGTYNLRGSGKNAGHTELYRVQDGILYVRSLGVERQSLKFPGSSETWSTSGILVAAGRSKTSDGAPTIAEIAPVRPGYDRCILTVSDGFQAPKLVDPVVVDRTMVCFNKNSKEMLLEEDIDWWMPVARMKQLQDLRSGNSCDANRPIRSGYCASQLLDTGSIVWRGNRIE